MSSKLLRVGRGRDLGCSGGSTLGLSLWERTAGTGCWVSQGRRWVGTGRCEGLALHRWEPGEGSLLRGGHAEGCPCGAGGHQVGLLRGGRWDAEQGS